MILPIYIYGSPVLRKTAANITPDYPGLQQFIADMWETMYDADGVGLAAPQVGKSIRMFVVDASPWARAKIYPAQLWRQVRRWFPWLLMLKAGWFEYRWRQTGDQQFIRLADDTWRQLLIKQ